ncbi:ADP-ribosyltransferase-containing protein, partial [Helicobacter bilis]
LISEAQAHKESGAKGEYKGQVAGAFYREELGDIDLVWGEVKGKGKEAKGYGLAKIIEKHGDEFKDIAKEIDKIIQNGKVITQNGVSTIWYKKDENIYKLGISKGFHKKGDNNWIITSYKAEREKDKTFGDALFTDKHPLPNSSDIIPQQTLESTMQKFNYDYKKAKDLLEWHKDSSPLTKDENGLPKVFYHGTTLSNMKRLHNKELKKPFEVFNTKDNSVSNFSIGNWFSNDKNLAKNYADDDEGNFIYEVFLNIKKPFIMEKELTQEKIKEIDKIFKFTKKDKERGLRAVENLKQAKAELKESGFEFLQYDRESVKIRHIESGKEFSTPLYNLKKEYLHESIRAYEADLKHNPNLDESLQELKELDLS